MPNTKDINLTNKKVKGMIVSPTGAGKTTFMATWPWPYFFDFDGGLGAMAGRDIAYDILPEPNIKAPIAYQKAERILFAIHKSGVENGQIIWDDSADDEKGKFVTSKVKGEIESPLRVIESIHLDASTSFLDVCMYYMQFIRASQKNPPGRVPAEHDWYPQMEAYRRFVVKLLSLADLGYAHIWVGAHEKIKELKEGEYVIGVKNLPGLTGRLSQQLGGAFDFVWRIEADNVGGKRRTRILTQTRGIVECKNRFEEAFELYEEPTYENIMGKLSAYFESKK